jgi:hypothetical protein
MLDFSAVTDVDDDYDELRRFDGAEKDDSRLRIEDWRPGTERTSGVQAQSA